MVCVIILISNHFPLLVVDQTAVHLTRDGVSDSLKYGNVFKVRETEIEK